MKNKLIILVLFSAILFATACSDNASNNNKSDQAEKQIDTADEKTTPVKEEVSNTQEPENIEKNTGTKTYENDLLSLEYPASFTVKSSLEYQEIEGGHSSVFFESPDKLVEFYAFASSGDNETPDIDLTENEKLVAEKQTKKNAGTSKTWTIQAKDGSYIRSYMSINYYDGLILMDIVGIKYKNIDAYKKYKTDYIAFKKSFLKYNL